MMETVELAALSGLLGLTVGEIHFFVMRRREHFLRKAERLTHAAQNLDTHSGALERFVEDGAAPIQLKEILLHFSGAISHKDMARQCAHALVADEHASISDEARIVMHQLDELRVDRPGLAQAFDVTVLSGLLYMLLRWPETAKVFEEATSRIASDPTRGVGFAAKAARIQSDGPPEHLGGYGPAPAMVGV